MGIGKHPRTSLSLSIHWCESNVPRIWETSGVIFHCDSLHACTYLKKSSGTATSKGSVICIATALAFLEGHPDEGRGCLSKGLWRLLHTDKWTGETGNRLDDFPWKNQPYWHINVTWSRTLWRNVKVCRDTCWRTQWHLMATCSKHFLVVTSLYNMVQAAIDRALFLEL